MVKIVNATEAKNRFGKIIQQAYLHGQHLIIQRDKIPVVAIVPMADYARLIPNEQVSNEVAHSIKEERARQRLFKLLEKIHNRVPDVSEKEAHLDIEKAVKAVRSRK